MRSRKEEIRFMVAALMATLSSTARASKKDNAATLLLLQALATVERARPSDLATALDVHQSTISRQMQSLEEEGFVPPGVTAGRLFPCRKPGWHFSTMCSRKVPTPLRSWTYASTATHTPLCRGSNSPGPPDIYLFRVERGGHIPLHVVWERRDAFSAEDAQPTPFRLQWEDGAASAVDALGLQVPTQVRDGQIELQISLTPIFLEA